MDLIESNYPGTDFSLNLEQVRGQKHGKYHRSLQSLKPIRFTSKHNAPVDNAGLFSTITLSWLSKTLYRARKKLKFEDIPPISASESVGQSAPRLFQYYMEEKEKKGDKANLGVAIFRLIRTRFWISVLMSAIAFMIALVAPALIVNRLIIYSSTSGGNIGYGIGLCFAMFGSDLVRTLSSSASWVITLRTVVRTRNAVAHLLYWKLIRLKSLNQKSTGEMINLLVNDLQRIVDHLLFACFLCSSPVGIIAGTVYAGFVLGWTGIMGLIGYLLLVPVQAVTVKLGVKYRASSILLTDQRVKIMGEILNCMKVIKLYAWESSFGKVIGDIRKKEQGFLVKLGAIQVIINGLIPLSPIYVTVLTLLLHTGLGYPLTAPQAFTTMIIFNSMRFAVGVLPISIKAFTEALVAVRRFNEVLAMEEMDEYQSPVADKDHAIELKDMTALSIKTQQSKDDKIKQPDETPTSNRKKTKSGVTTNHDQDEVVLVEEINLSVKRCGLVGVCGAVGSGKSSLILSILGQVRLHKGSVGVNGSVAYVPQQAWVFHASLRENILFGLPFDKFKYEQTIQSCALQSDIDMLPNGDLTEIGERGINLSGGQKQRISLARAVYSDRDIVLLDDPLSAVDAHVGMHIFNNCIKQQLAEKTVVLVSHQLQYFKQCDSVVMLKDGRIAEYGSYSELIEVENEFAELMRNYQMNVETQNKTKENNDVVLDENSADCYESISPVTSPGSPTQRKVSVALMAEESQEFGSIKWKTYKTYCKALGGYILSVLIFLHSFSFIFLSSATTFWITFWINEGGQLLCSNGTNTTNLAANLSNCTRDPNIVTNPKRGFYQMIYGVILAAAVLVLALRAVSYPYFVIRASTVMHKRLFKTIMRCTMSYFDRTPVGQILNRFSKDIDEMDNQLVTMLNSCIQLSSMTLLSLITICVVFPYFLIACAVLLTLFLLLFNVYRSGIREIKRYASVCRSPWISHVAATVHGLSSIHAYGKTDVFVKTFGEYIDTHSVPFHAYYSALQWIAVRLDSFNMFSNFVVALMVVIATSYPQVFGIGQSSALVGLALTYSVQIAGLLTAMVRFLIEAETLFTSAERVREYAEITTLEKPAIIESNRPSESWPEHGAITFENVSMRYREDLPSVLRNVQIDIKPGEKIGIVGRTGSGKSSLGVALFRLVELSEGRICIDGVDISQIGLEDLRKKLTIIPQDPVLFVGSIRYNLDPFSQYSDEKIWKAVERSHIKELINDLPQKLDSEVVQNGENFSVGERQLLCMARAILRHSQIIMLDEATAAIDSETDSLVQDTIREAFAACTVLTIAHRLNTILNSDKIVVMKDGKVAEFAETQKLMKNDQSQFSQLLAAASKSNENIGDDNFAYSITKSNMTTGYVNPSYNEIE